MYPNLSVHVTSDDKITKETIVASDIILRPVEPKQLDNFKKRWGVEYNHGLFASKDYLKKHGTPEKPEDLLNHCLIGYGEYEFSYFPQINWHLKGKTAGLPKVSPGLTINSTAAIFVAAKEGIGI